MSMTTSTYEHIKAEVIGKVLRLTLDHPDQLNALSQAMMDELLAAIGRAAVDPEVSVIVIRGEGRAFCAGYDISGDGTGGVPSMQGRIGTLLTTNDRWRQVWRCPIPIIAQVHGYCIAGGTDLALSCDFVIVADNARIGFPPVRTMGVPPAQMWIYHLGLQWTKRMLLTGDMVTGSFAAEIGLALEAVAPAALDDHVLEFATRMAHVERDLLIGNKFVVNRAVDLMGRDVLQDIAAVQDAVGHLAPSAGRFWQTAKESGLRAALKERDAPFAAADPIA